MIKNGGRILKIAIACDKLLVCKNLDICERFIIYEVENKLVKSQIYYENFVHHPWLIPWNFKNLHIDIVIVGDMDMTVKKLFCDHHTEVIVGISGSYEESIQNYLKESRN